MKENCSILQVEGMPSAGLLLPVWELKKANVAIRP